MRRGTALLREQLEASFETAGITFVQWATLILVRDNPGTTPGEVCRDLRHDSGAFTRLVDQLEQRGLLQRVPNDSDRRSVHLRLTADGRRMIDVSLPRVVGLLNDALADFTPAEVGMLTALLTRMIARLEAGDRDTDADRGRP
jgi:DNA-binding MarR family transcriptional regulator